MFSYATGDVNEALSIGLRHLLDEGLQETSRNGVVLVAPRPVCIEYSNPRSRVLYSATRDANPVFHFMESLWMLSGSNEIEFPSFFSSGYGQYSDDGTTMWDAYGWRWRAFFGYDQLAEIIEELKENPDSRRCVLAMWNASAHHIEIGLTALTWEDKQGEAFYDDLAVATNGGSAVPCNTHAYFAIRDGRLNMTVMNRSNDAIWGCFGANVVHFSFLLEYMAVHIGVPMGSYFQFTNNLHVYTDKFNIEKLNAIEQESYVASDAKEEQGPMLEPDFDADLALFMPWALQVIRSSPGGPHVLNVPACETTFMTTVAIPMFLFWTYRKWKDEYSSNVCLDGIAASDWQRACQEWVDRRVTK